MEPATTSRVHHPRIIARHVDSVRLRRFNNDDLLLRGRLAAARGCLDRDLLRAHHLLGRRLQFVVRLCQSAKALHSGEHVGLLRRKRITELLQPRQIAVQGRQHDGKEGLQRLHARIPRLGLQGLHQRVAGQ